MEDEAVRNRALIRVGREACRHLERALTREWLETNGLGGFASSTIVGVNTRRYHGLLVAATQPPVGRRVLLSKLEETLILAGHRYELSANRYPGVVHPQGYRFLSQFRLDPFPVFTYEVEGLELEKTVFMIQGENTTVVRYALTSDARDFQSRAIGQTAELRLELRPLVAFRDYHSLTHENPAIDGRVEVQRTSVTVKPYPGLPALHLTHLRGHVTSTGNWYRHFEYEAERARGLDFVEDLFNPCVLTFDLGSLRTVTIVASTEPVEMGRVDAAHHAEEERRRTIVAASSASDDCTRALVAAADQFIVARGEGQTVIAGYHWFSDWGRDTMIALPGLTLATGRVDVARRILLEFSHYVDGGMIPSRFPDAGEPPEYAAVDATLWFFQAVWAFFQRTRDDAFVRANLYDVLGEMIAWHVGGTRHGIHIDADGLLAAGPAGVPLTWMDAKIGEGAVTPRHGKPVEIQALWYNALRIMEALARQFGDQARQTLHRTQAAHARRSFNRLFWNAGAGCLYDVVDGEARDASIRPNQILALSLPFSMLSRAKATSVVNVVERLLLTPYGLRTLAPTDARYCGHYDGDARSRDGAYHQGTVWPWLMGPFITAYARVNNTNDARAKAAEWLKPLRDHLYQAGLGQVSEVFDGDPPYRPGGCIAQAWSVAELLRVMLEEGSLA